MTEEEIYSKLYNVGNAILKENNPCQFQTTDGVTTCVANRAASPYGNTSNINGCCHKCPHLGPTGCMTDSLACKLWTCGYLAKQPSAQVVIISLEALQTASRAAGMPPSIWKSREESFKQYREYVPFRKESNGADNHH